MNEDELKPCPYCEEWIAAEVADRLQAERDELRAELARYKRALELAAMDRYYHVDVPQWLTDGEEGTFAPDLLEVIKFHKSHWLEQAGQV